MRIVNRWKTWKVCLFTALCILLNLAGRELTNYTRTLFWFDSFGTALIAYVLGPFAGSVVGVAANVIYAMIHHVTWLYASAGAATGIIIGLAARHKKLDTFLGTVSTSVYCMVATVILSVPLNILLSNGMTGNRWGDGIIGFYSELGVPRMVSYVIGQAYVDFSDKTITLILLYLVMKIIRVWQARKTEDQPADPAEKPETPAASTLAGLLVMCLVLGGGAVARAAEPEFVDYNDYVQAVFSSSNGLPCGEANDIAETHDGILWVGTYAGLYRYNGNEFRWISGYDSVRNVNCLYVDEEGRLWIGTNDNGLSIAIDESVVNVIDDRKGLPSNSVKAIVRDSEGYYYIGTTSSMQVLTLNSGLKQVNTLTEMNYTISVGADERGNVAAVTNDGRLYLLNRGQILSSAQLVEGDEKFKSCTFDPDGTLLAGTTSNHIYTYDISGGVFEKKGEIICGELKNIKDMEYLEDGVLFITSDSGIGYLNRSGVFDRINTNEFNNSIDHMLVDYQGNFWFTSSRLGLLRMSPSSFKDVYSTAGMERRVVNAVDKWQGSYYIGTDNGLDIVDGACRNPISNELTEQLRNTRIRCLRVDSKDHLWICTYDKGLIEVEPEGTQYIYNDENGSFGNTTRTVMELSDGEVVVAGDTGISFIRDHKVHGTIRYSDGKIKTKILTLLEMKDGLILAGTDGDGIAVIQDGQVTKMFKKKDGLSSDVILRLIPDTQSEGVFVVTSNGLCFMDENSSIRFLDRFPYYNNYDIWAKDQEKLFVMSSAGIYVVDRSDLLFGTGSLSYDLLDGKTGLTSALTVNSWNYDDGEGDLFLPCDTGLFIIDTDRYTRHAASYRMSIAGIRLDNSKEVRRVEHSEPIVIDRGVGRFELFPEIINYTIQDLNVGYKLEGFDAEYKTMMQSELRTIEYTNLPAGTYTLHLAVFDNGRENILEERLYRIIKTQEIYDNTWFILYVILVAMAFGIWMAAAILHGIERRNFEKQQREIQLKDRQLEMGNQTILAIANAVDAKDKRTNQHSLRVSIYSYKIGKELGLSEEECRNLEKAARLHDIGKIGIPDAVLNKPGRLDDKEYAQMKSHVTRGAEILKGFTLIDHVIDGALYHHERYDGKGYPQGLKGEEIPLYGRIIGVADAFDAMTANRVYRKQMDFGYVLNEMKNGRGTQFDPEFVDILLRLIDKGEIDLKKLYSGQGPDNDDAIDSQTAAAT